MQEQSKPYPQPDALRSRIMRSNKSHGNLSTELTLVRLLRVHGLTGWRRRLSLPGKPDFVFKKERVAVFVDGCYWHGCSCRRLPKTNQEYWLEKFRDNRSRDQRVNRSLRALGWTVVRIKEHQLKRKPNWVVSRISQFLPGKTS